MRGEREMPKLKTKKGVAKRFKVTAKGKVKYAPCNKSHLLTNKKRSRVRKLRESDTVSLGKHEKYLKRLLPYA
jgi:large subunit ribosomal protein L35